RDWSSDVCSSDLPLRELRDDLDWIWEGVYAEAAARAGVEPTAISADGHAEVVARLQQHLLPGNVRDLYRVAYRLLAHAEDAAEQLAVLVTSALVTAEPPTPRALATESPVTATLQACAAGDPLDVVYDTYGPIPAKATIAAVKQHIAQEARALAKSRGLRINDVADVTDRTLLNWAPLPQS